MLSKICFWIDFCENNISKVHNFLKIKSCYFPMLKQSYTFVFNTKKKLWKEYRNIMIYIDI